MTETLHTRSRRAALGGLILQLVVFAGALVLGPLTNSLAVAHLAWYLLGGVPLWFVALLVFRQHELAALEALDLEELRREKQATGGGEALFGAEGGGPGFRVAEARLRWMQRWFIPVFGLLTALYLGGMGAFLWRNLAVSGFEITSGTWPAPVRVPIGMVMLAIVMFGTILYSRYTSGMARVTEWQLLRGCGSYMLGNGLVVTALLVCLGVFQYAGVATWEHVLACVVPVLMLVLALETAINFVLDIYRPRTAGVEPRACFDSRLLGLFAEPGGIAHSIAEAMNYQFGFQVSQTWFYQLLQRAFVPLVATGALALWLLTGVVIVQPYEHVVIERFGRQLNATAPLGPGLHFKRPYPFEEARAYNTGQLHQLHVGYKQIDAELDESKALTSVQLWTDELHMGQEHFEFLVCPTRQAGAATEPTTQPLGELEGEGEARESPVHLMRLDAVLQYRIQTHHLDRFTQTTVDPDDTLLAVAWEEVSQFMASTTADYLLGEELRGIGEKLRQRIAARVQDLGLEVVYVGITNVHPEKTVAEAYRKVVTAEQEKVTAIRGALVAEDESLSKVAGEAKAARVLAGAVERARKAGEAAADAGGALATLDPAVVAEFSTLPAELEKALRDKVDAEARLERARDRQREIEQDYELGFGQTAEQRLRAQEAEAQAASEARRTAADLETALSPLRTRAAAKLAPAQVAALVRSLETRTARTYWDERLSAAFTPARLEGEAASKLAAALGDRWTIEMGAARELTEAQNEREAYRAAPEIYKARRLMDVLVEGLKDARKIFLGFEPAGRTVRVRFTQEDDSRLDMTEIAPRSAP